MTDFQPGWPCVAAQSNAPSIEDRLSQPSGDDLLPQILALCPRGPAWGTDEAGDGQGASPLMRLFWSAVARWSAISHTLDFQLAAQALPSEVTWSLPDWEAELGLPDPCVGPLAGTADRVIAVRAKYAGVGGQSPNFFICLAQSLGFVVCQVEEFQPFRIGDKVGQKLYGPAWAFAFRIHANTVSVRYFKIGDKVGSTLASWGNALLECLIRRAMPAHTIAIFAYDCDSAVLTADDGTPLTSDSGDLLTV